MAYLELRGIRKSYYIGKRAFPVLKGIDLTVELGEFVAILGESGGGKTTLMNIISGLDRQFDGTVTVHGQELDHLRDRQLDRYRRETIGYISQSYNLIRHLNVLENVLLALDMTKLSRGERTRRAHELLQQVGLADQAKKYPSQLSGGQQQRVAIARALAGDPPIVVADEPTGALDADNTAEVMRILQQIAADGRMVICVTHSDRVAQAANRVEHLVDGQIKDQQVLRPLASDQTQPAPARQTIATRPLPLHVSFTTAFRHMRFTWSWNSLIVLGTAIGLFAVMLFAGLGNGIRGYINHQINNVVDPQSITVMRYSNNGKDQEEQSAAVDPAVAGTIAPHMQTFSPQQLQALRELHHVIGVEPGISATNATISIGNNRYSAPELTTWTSTDPVSSLKAGHPAGNNQIVLDKTTIAQKWSATNWRQLVGKTVTVAYQTLNAKGRPVTVQRQLKVAGIVDSPSGASLNAVNYATMQSMSQAAGLSKQPTFATVRVAVREQNEAVVNEINQLKVGGQQQFSANSISTTLDRVNTYVGIATAVLAAIAGISLAVSALMIIVTMYMSVSARMKEIGVLRSLGESRRDIRRLFTSEALMLGGLSAVLATGLAYGLGAILNHWLYRIAGYPLVQIHATSIALIFGLAIVIAWLAAILPARRAARANPIKALAAK
ncbi:ATP-binding cassette domain-containing protein [Lactiplantibacillus garii]|uniref:ATP-binding cassette domain-containing protein n=1 Tax=Lactiplantibacillus garii TaxID=2306423 RepID=A0A426D7B6_9LACO|nr:ABC transporter ATP-binding protein/permease [Lactiplantibacillus garii]RRK10477.1 ATP-binding cassette domain-containing protein [Lactiplantibacillus garii]